LFLPKRKSNKQIQHAKARRQKKSKRYPSYRRWYHITDSNTLLQSKTKRQVPIGKKKQMISLRTQMTSRLVNPHLESGGKLHRRRALAEAPPLSTVPVPVSF
jgi:very-short-patch-repair endonuclease